MKKLLYKEAELEVIKFEIEDVITASGDNDNPDDWGNDHDVGEDL